MRYLVVLALFLLSIITYMDRVCMSSAKDSVVQDFGFSDSAMGLIFGAFALGYALSQIPAGWFADRFGPRLTLTLVVLAWSLFTALTGVAWSLASMIAIQFLFGVGEAGAFPGSARAIINWLPTGERGRANGVLFSGSRLGAAFAFPFLAWQLARHEWRTVFLILGLIGAVWAVLWMIWYRDPRGAESGARRDDLARGGREIEAQAGLLTLIRSGSIPLAMIQYFASNFTFFICLSWMLPYLKREYHLSGSKAAAYAAAPLLMGATSQWIAGWLVDRLYRSRLRVWSRRIPGILGFALAAIGVLALTTATTPVGAVICFTFATFGADMTISPSWVYCADIAGRNAGSVSGSMNMLGNIGSFVSANAFPFLLGMTGDAKAYFIVAALLNLIGILCWLGMRSIQEVEL